MELRATQMAINNNVQMAEIEGGGKNRRCIIVVWSFSSFKRGPHGRYEKGEEEGAAAAQDIS